MVPNTELSDTGKLPDHCSRANWTASYLCYLEDWLQKSSRWSKMSQNQTKKVIQHANTANPSHCPVYLFKLYNSLSPIDHQAFYLQPVKKSTKDSWYSIKALGHNNFRKMVQQMCKLAGITATKPNIHRMISHF